MKASIIVLSWNGMAYLKSCLDAVLAQDYADFELIVVDNGSTDGSADFVKTHYPNVRLICNAHNLGFAAGNNIGLQAATGDVLVLLNQDAIVTPGWLSALCAPLEDASVGIVGCKLLYPDGTLQHAGGRITDMRATPWHIGYGETDDGQYDVSQDVDFVTGASIALTRTTLTHIGPLDEGFTPAYYEDTDWCYRARAAGLRVVYCPQAVAVHYESASSDTQSYEHRVMFHSGRLRFLFKHQPLPDLHEAFLAEEAASVQDLGPGLELEALRQACLSVLLALPDIVQSRVRMMASDTDPQVIWQMLLHVALALRDVLVKPQPFYAVHETLDSLEARTLGEQFLNAKASDTHQNAQDAADTWAAQIADLHKTWQLSPQPFHSDVPVVGAGISAFREAWVNVATRWYIEPLLVQQRAFNANVTQVLAYTADRLNQDGAHLNRLAMSQVELLHIVRQMADNVTRAQQENAQHVRELNALLSEVLQLRARVTDLETRLKE